jgi:hypothetical protein
MNTRQVLDREIEALSGLIEEINELGNWARSCIIVGFHEELESDSMK